jgi:hypothetical protein
VPSLSARDLERCLVAKLRAVERRGGDHRVFELYDEAGNLVATTAFSRSWRGGTSIGPVMVSAIRRELGLRAHPDAFARLVACPLTREAYLGLVAGPEEG